MGDGNEMEQTNGREGMGWEQRRKEGLKGRKEGTRAGQVYNKLITTVPTLPYLTYHRERKSERRKSRRGSLSATNLESSIRSR